MVTTTTVYSFQKPAVAGDEDQWGTYLNNNIDKYESILTGNTTITSVVITTADINGGTLDNVVIGGTTAAAVTGTTITGTSFVSSGDMTFGDNNKAIFGAGSDLQIYHDGSNSYIDDAGTGNLTIRANQINFDKYTGEALARFRADGNTELFYDNAAKLATTSTGIDVTGTVTADSLTVDTNTLHVDATNNRIGVGTTSPSSILDISSTASPTIRVTDSDNSNTAFMQADGVNGAYFGTLTNHPIRFAPNNSTKMIITSSGLVGIGVTDPANYDWANTIDLVVGNTSGSSGLSIVSSTTSGGNIAFADGTTGNERYRGYIYYDHASDYMSYWTAGSEAIRIDSSSRLLVGKTSNSNSTAGTTLYGNGKIEGVRDGGSVHQMNRLTSDGSILDFQKDGTTVGSIGVSPDGASFGNATQHIAMHSNVLFPSSNAHSYLDATIDLGTSSGRFKNLYLSGGVYLGGTGSANHLDDYEEGTFTPVVYGTTSNGTGTYTHQRGSYVKIGNLVNVQIHLGWSAHTGTGDMRVSGLPFNTENYLTYGYSGPNIHYASGLTFTRTQVGGYLAGSSDILVFSQFDSGVVSGVPMDSAVTELIITATYRST